MYSEVKSVHLPKVALVHRPQLFNLVCTVLICKMGTGTTRSLQKFLAAKYKDTIQGPGACLILLASSIPSKPQSLQITGPSEAQ